MFCPKCGIENPDDAKTCRSCGQELQKSSETAKTSIAAILSSISVMSSIAFIVLFYFVSETILFLIAWAFLLTLVMAILLGIIALIKIHKSKGTLKGKFFAKAGIFISLFIILPSLICPSLGKIGPSARIVMQKAQFHSIDAALELFDSEVNSYPPSDALDKDKNPYCGAMKLCEAIMGQDLMGFHPDSKFKRDGTNDYNNPLYGPATLQARKEPFLQLENAHAYQIKDIYKNVGPFDRNSYVICDRFTKQRHSGKRTGMPILYYKADTSKTKHNLENPDDANNIYNYKDNYALLELGVPGKQGKKHPLFNDPKIFYEMTKNYSITTERRPCRADSYILISAGLDGLYGTKDDITNFEAMEAKIEGKEYER